METNKIEGIILSLHLFTSKDWKNKWVVIRLFVQVHAISCFRLYDYTKTTTATAATLLMIDLFSCGRNPPLLIENISKRNFMTTMVDLENVGGYDERRLTIEKPKPW
jgi:hypothetical protein